MISYVVPALLDRVSLDRAQGEDPEKPVPSSSEPTLQWRSSITTRFMAGTTRPQSGTDEGCACAVKLRRLSVTEPLLALAVGVHTERSTILRLDATPLSSLT